MNLWLKTAVCVAMGAFTARANIIVVFDNPNQTGNPGQTLSFYGVISNTGTDTDPNDAIYLNSDNVDLSLSAASYTLTDNFANTPVDLVGGASSPDIDLFDITLSNPVADPYGNYAGTYTLLGGPDQGTGSDSEILSQTSFSIFVTPASPTAPEPATWMLLAASLIGLGAASWRRGQKRS